MILFKILPIEAIEKQVLKDQSREQNFPATVDFPFPGRYKKLVTSIKTIELASEAILYNSVEAVNENKESEMPDYWCFAGNGQGDRWFLGQHDEVFFYDHDDEKLHSLHISFEQWLQLTFVIQKLDQYFDEYDKIPEAIQQSFYDTLNTIHPALGENYPFTV